MDSPPPLPYQIPDMLAGYPCDNPMTKNIRICR